MKFVVVGAGAVGARAGRQLLTPLAGDASPTDVVVVDPDADRLAAVVDSLGAPARAVPQMPAIDPGDVVLLAMPGGHRAVAESVLDRGGHVVSVCDAIGEVRALIDLDDDARRRGLHLVIGAGFSPGLSCVLASLAARAFERVDEIHVAKVGTAGPACARQHHRALAEHVFDWRDGEWEERSGGSGRELCWFPDPVRAVDCYRAATPEPLLLAPAFAGVNRVTARMGANRRDRLTARLPMLRRPHPEGDLGAIRVEVRGVQGTAREDRVLGVIDRPAIAAGAVSALACRLAATGRLLRPGAAGLAALVEPGPFLTVLAERGVKVAIFEGGQHGAPVVPRT
ncbi:MAG: NAD(P)-binding domain-containing protein [Actinomycetota bacterium]|nr:NAD(P)-binding domain-containing protein [Actinomycetota bacterium]